MGAVVNMRPDLFSAVIMGVPFLDVLTTMLDDTIPLTIIEKEEWGDPNVSSTQLGFVCRLQEVAAEETIRLQQACLVAPEAKR